MNVRKEITSTTLFGIILIIIFALLLGIILGQFVKPLPEIFIKTETITKTETIEKIVREITTIPIPFIITTKTTIVTTLNPTSTIIISNQPTITTIATLSIRTQTLFKENNVYIPSWNYLHSGPYYLKAGQTITVKWDADGTVLVYILNDNDWANRFLEGTPTSYRAYNSGISGTLSYTLKYDEPIYIQIIPFAWASAKLYVLEGTLSW
jgi:hypothetical protein